MFASQGSGLNKEGLGYNGGNPFIKSYRLLKNAHSLQLKCKFCDYTRHTITKCPIRNDKQLKIRKVWELKRTLKTNLNRPKTI